MPLSELSRDLAGRVAVVTGASSGMGRATARLFADLGVRVAVADITEGPLASLVAEIESVGAEAKAFKVDLSKAHEIKDFADAVLKHFGEVDILINNAGVPGLSSRAIDGKDTIFEQDWERQVSVNILAQARLVRAFGRSLRRKGEGRIVNIASTEGSGATLFQAPYTAAKHAVVGLTKALAVELASQGICVNCVQPGPIRTGMTSIVPEKSKEYFAKRVVPMRRYGLPEEVAQVTVSLCLPAFRYMNGAIIPVDGGVLANNALLPMKFPWREVTQLPDEAAASKL